MLTLMFILAVAVPTPSPSSTPELKEITRTRSSAFCTAMRENVALTVVGLRTNDAIIGKSKIGFAKFAHDTAIGGNRADMDILYLESLVGSMGHNLKLIEKLLSDPKRFPVQAQSPDEQRLNELKAKLEAVADRQRESLNVINGIVDTQQMGALQKNNDDAMNSAVGPKGGHQSLTPHNPTNASLYDAGIGHEPPGFTDPRSQAWAMATNAGPYAGDIRDIDQREVAIGDAESAVTPDIVASVAGCR